MPIYNVAPYLKECLDSIILQSYENLAIILVDDGSDDESLEIALNFAKNDERIFVVSKPNGGLSSARNFGLEFIKGSALRTFLMMEIFRLRLNMTKAKLIILTCRVIPTLFLVILSFCKKAKHLKMDNRLLNIECHLSY